MTTQSNCHQAQEQLEVLLRNMTNPELIGYANTKPAATPLELELAKRFEVEIFGNDYARS